MSISDANSAKRARIASQSPVNDQLAIHSGDLNPRELPPLQAPITFTIYEGSCHPWPEGCLPAATRGVRAHSRSAYCVSSKPRTLCILDRLSGSQDLVLETSGVFPRNALFMATTLCTLDSVRSWAESASIDWIICAPSSMCNGKCTSHCNQEIENNPW